MGKNPNNYTHIFKYTGVFGGIQGLNILVGLVRNKLVALLLGPQGMGLVALFNSSVKLLNDSTNLGLPMSAVRKIADAYENGQEADTARMVRLVRSWCLLTALVGTLLCCCLSTMLDAWTFSWGNHVWHFVFLSPLVGLMAVTGGEMAVLKGIRQLGQLARISVYNVLAATALSVPIYWYFGEKGIVPSLVLVGAMQMVLTVWFSCRHFRYRVSLSLAFLSQGIDIVKLGLAFVLAGVVGSGADFLIRSWLNYHASVAMVGLFNAGYMLAVTYAGMVFTALESDYFPRLSAISAQRVELCRLVNSQTEVSLIMITPLLVALIVGIPILLPLLFSSKFLPVAGMIQVSALSMFCKALYLPVEYIPLAKGDSRSYFFLELINDVCMVTAVLVGFNFFGLKGAGYGLLTSAAVEMVVSYLYVRYKYGFILSAALLRTIACFAPWLLAAFLLTFLQVGWGYWLIGMALVVITSVLAARAINEKSEVWKRIKQKLGR